MDFSLGGGGRPGGAGAAGPDRVDPASVVAGGADDVCSGRGSSVAGSSPPLMAISGPKSVPSGSSSSPPSRAVLPPLLRPDPTAGSREQGQPDPAAGDGYLHCVDRGLQSSDPNGVEASRG
jgi:hypothetical protein